MAASEVADNATSNAATAELPPSRQVSADELIAEMKKVPLFMTSMDDMDEDNEMIQALKAIAYEGTRAEVAENFRVQGNECVQTKQWQAAREFYTKALAALRGPRIPQGLPPDVVVEEIDEEAEEKKERKTEEACYANRALCNLEMKNYGSCNRDCAGALKLNPKNVKAWYRAATACLSLDKLPEALDACQSGLKFDPHNAALKPLLERIQKRQIHVAELERKRQERLDREANERATLRLALKQRNILSRDTGKAPDMEDARVQLTNTSDANSTLTLPVIFLYPLHAQSDFVKAFAEDESITQHLGYILPTPWDEAKEYSPTSVECYMETAAGGLIKAGKNLALSKLLGSGKVEVVDGLVSINVVPKAKATVWIEEFKQRRGKQ